MLWIYGSGQATTAEIERGVEAAMTYFREHGIDPLAAHAASLAAADVRVHDPALAWAWAEAEMTAFKAAFAHWVRWPEGATLGLA